MHGWPGGSRLILSRGRRVVAVSDLGHQPVPVQHGDVVVAPGRGMPPEQVIVDKDRPRRPHRGAGYCDSRPEEAGRGVAPGSGG